MEVIILAGGLGTRLREVIPDLPKPMAPVAGKPFLELVLRALCCQGVDSFIISVGYKADTICSHFGERFEGASVRYSIEETPLGTGGAVRQAMTMCEGDHALVLNGDSYVDLDIHALETDWRARQIPLIVAHEVEDSARYGCITMKRGSVVGFSEKGVHGPGLINAGGYVFPTSILKEFPSCPSFSLENDFLKNAVTRITIGLHITCGRFIDIGIPEDYRRAQTLLADLCLNP
jgi:D-glycero-alpha-D-manno-heptose 1-phosphate guanylyltransferase